MPSHLTIPELTEQDLQRFWAKVQVGAINECWTWTAAVNSAGYGRWGIRGRDGRNYYAHRVAYAIAHGHMPVDLVVDHLCRNASCCNPAHLEAVKQRENCMRGRMPYVALHHVRRCVNGHELTANNVSVIRESRKGGRPVERCRACRLESARLYRQRLKGRHRVAAEAPRGEARTNSKLTDEAVREARRLFAAGDASGAELAKRYGVCEAAMSNAINRKTWRHV